jgi:Protein of unknown function (DUF3179)
VKLFIALVLLLAACSPQNSLPGATQLDALGESAIKGSFRAPVAVVRNFPKAPEFPNGPLDVRISGELDALLNSILADTFDSEALQGASSGGDIRIAWFVADLMRFFQGGSVGGQLDNAFQTLTGYLPDPSERTSFVPAFELLLEWDLPAWDGYDELKRDLYTIVEPGWEPFFDMNVSIDWRPVTWGGVRIDDRELGDPNPCIGGCIPALDDPPTVPALEASWYDDGDVVFGVIVGDDVLALPRNQMEVHEMLNLTLGGRRLGIPYCTLCGSAQAYFTDSVPDGFSVPVLRTSGLLTRSNKVMYDLNTNSVFDTFTGEALSGSLGEAAVVLDQASVVASTWGEWRTAHPDTRIIAQDGGLGRIYDRDPLGNRDANGPIFPIGPSDQRLPVQEKVVGVIASDGTPLAFPVAAVGQALASGTKITYEGLEVIVDGDGLRVVGPDGDVGSHQSYWFAWSQFYPSTLVWLPDD